MKLFEMLLLDFRSLGAVFRTALTAVRNTCGIQSSADDVVTGTGEILDTAAADENDAVLLKVVAFAGDVARHFDAVRLWRSF